MTLKLVSPDVAREMEIVASRHNDKCFQSWPINSRQSLVATADSVEHWNAIAGVSKIEVLAMQRRFPFIFPSTDPNAPRPSAHVYTRILTTTILLAIGVLVGAASVVWLIGRGISGQCPGRVP